MSLSWRNNNPGNLRYSPFSKKCGATKENRGFAVFGSAVEGTAALVRLLAGKSYRNLSIKSALEKYAPPVENDTGKYLKFVCVRAQLKPDHIIAKLEPLEFLRLCDAIIRFEGWSKD